jgi:hypothetical protein
LDCINFIKFQEENNNDVQIDSSNQNQQTNYINDINVEANLAILQNRLLSASNKFGITLIKGEFLELFPNVLLKV